eukprot:TRINITY_DN10223_c0_g1_i1.p1 TRINITY_DN10223_c0_g1~~TRINITY_DN10223_c0_g1_i1.p1  ORF type:complete len:621 (-),score=135.01 TRINITY_DN10223_c0_g1_i1:1225-2832(-)
MTHWHADGVLPHRALQMAQNFPVLYELTLTSCKPLLLQDIRSLQPMQSVACLSIDFPGVSDVVLKTLAELFPNLERFSFHKRSSFREGLTSNGLAGVAAKCPRLKSVCVIPEQLAQWLDDVCLAHMASSLTYIQQLHVPDCKLTDHGLSYIAKHCQSLTDLNVTRCVQLTAAGMLSLVQSLSSLQVFHAAFSGLVDDAVLIALAQHSQLRDVQLGHYNRFTHIGLSALATGCRLLSTLDLTLFTLWTTECASAIAAMRGLTHLALRSIRFAKGDLDTIAQAGLGLKTLDLFQSTYSGAGVGTLLHSCANTLKYLFLESVWHESHNIVHSGCQWLKHLDVLETCLLSNEIADLLTVNFPHLIQLRIGQTAKNTPLRSDVCLPKNLEYLEIVGTCDSAAVVGIVRCCKQLQVLLLDKHCEIDHYAVVAITQHLSHVEHLQIAHKFSPAQLRLLTVCQQLRSLSLMLIDSLSDDWDCVQVLRACPQLRSVEVFASGSESYPQFCAIHRTPDDEQGENPRIMGPRRRMAHVLPFGMYAL